MKSSFTESTCTTEYLPILKKTQQTSIISPDIRQSFLLSSNTVFNLSIHIASTGPSNRIHLRSGVGEAAYSRNILANTPGIVKHSQYYHWPPALKSVVTHKLL